MPFTIFKKWAYTHVPIYEQLDRQGIRQIELDLHPNSSWNGLNVHHNRFLDNRTSCPTFIDCLTEVSRFSDAQPDHSPIFIFIQPKVSPKKEADMKRLIELVEAEIFEVFSFRLFFPRKFLATIFHDNRTSIIWL